MAEKAPLYARSLLEAHFKGEVKLWRESHQTAKGRLFYWFNRQGRLNINFQAKRGEAVTEIPAKANAPPHYRVRRCTARL